MKQSLILCALKTTKIYESYCLAHPSFIVLTKQTDQEFLSVVDFLADWSHDQYQLNTHQYNR